MKKITFFYFAVLFFSPNLFAGRSLTFQQTYSSRCPADDLTVFFTLRNMSTQSQTVKVVGGATVLYGDTGCGDSWSALGISFASSKTFSLHSGTGSPDILSGDWVKMKGGQVLLYILNMKSGGAGDIWANIEAQEDVGQLQASGTYGYSNLQSQAANVTFQVNNGRPF